MHEPSELIDALKKVLRAKGITYRDIAESLKLSEASIKRTFAEKSFTLQRLSAICQVAELNIYELARLAAHQDRNRSTTLSMEQETELASEPKLLAYFYLLINGWQPHRIKRRLAISEAMSTRLLTRLHRLELIELHARNRVRLLTSRTIAWRKSGPVRRLYEQQVKTEFLDSSFESADSALRFETAELSDASIQLISRKIEKLVKEFDELVELDMALPAEKKRSVGCMLALRPWVFSLLAH